MRARETGRELKLKYTHKVQLGARSQASENQFRPEREKSERSSRSAYIDDGVVVVVGGYIHPSPFCVCLPA